MQKHPHLVQGHVFSYDVPMFLPTAQEIILLKTIQEHGGTVRAEDSILARPHPETRRALEGCAAKGFVDMDGTGAATLTEKGRACI